MDLSILPPLIGYVLGTSQILILDWVRERRNHARALRFLLAEVLRLQAFTERYEYESVPDVFRVHPPRPPHLSARFVETVSEADFTITDEHLGDNFQRVLLSVADTSVALLEEFASVERDMAKFLEFIKGKRFDDLAARPTGVMEHYNTLADTFATQLHGVERDLRRRLREADLVKQLDRLITPLEAGTNPPDLNLGDERVAAFIRERDTRKATR